MENIINICPACLIDNGSYGRLNRHLLECVKYPTWLENYIPEVSIECEKCDRKFGISYIDKHKLDCDE